MDNLENFILFANYILVELEILEEQNEFGLTMESRNQRTPVYTGIGKVVKLGTGSPDHILLNDRILVDQNYCQSIKIDNKEYFRLPAHTPVGKYVNTEIL